MHHEEEIMCFCYYTRFISSRCYVNILAARILIANILICWKYYLYGALLLAANERLIL